MGDWYYGQAALGQKVYPQKVNLAGGFKSQPPAVTTPGTIASGGTITNTTGFDVMVYLSATTGTGTLSVNSSALPGTVPALAMASVYLPDSDTLSFTYTGTLTWTWLAV